MSNILYLTCRHHPSKVDSFIVTEREFRQPYAARSQANQTSFHKWLETHRNCGGTFDHFTVGYAADKDHDLAPEITQLDQAVRSILQVVK